MNYLDVVELVTEKEKYAKEGVHKGMQGLIWDKMKIDGCWLVNFPSYGENADIAEIPIKEEDLKLLPNGFNSVPNEEIKKAFENSQK